MTMVNSVQEARALAPEMQQKKSLQATINRMMPEIKKALPSVITPERFSRIVLTAISSNKELSKTTPESFLGAMMTAAQLGVEPNTPLGQAYLIPYRNHGQLECQFQLGYKGLIDLAYRSGEVRDISAQVVYEHDEFDFQFGLNPTLKHKPCMHGDRGSAIAYYAVYHTKDGGYGFDVMSVDDVKRHANKYSKAAGSSYSPWSTNFDQMAKKTVLKKLLKYAPMKTDFQRAAGMDETTHTTIGEDMTAEPIVPHEQVVGEVDQETGEILSGKE